MLGSHRLPKKKKREARFLIKKETNGEVKAKPRERSEVLEGGKAIAYPEKKKREVARLSVKKEKIVGLGEEKLNAPQVSFFSVLFFPYHHGLCPYSSFSSLPSRLVPLLFFLAFFVPTFFFSFLLNFFCFYFFFSHIFGFFLFLCFIGKYFAIIVSLKLCFCFILSTFAYIFFCFLFYSFIFFFGVYTFDIIVIFLVLCDYI